MIRKYLFITVFFKFSFSICPKDTLSYRWWCYKIVDDKNATFKEAISECEQFGGGLAPIESKEESDFLKLDKNLENGYWIGGLHVDSSYIWLTSGTYDQTSMKTFVKRFLYDDPNQIWCLSLQNKCQFCGKEEYYDTKEIGESKGWYLADSYCNERRSFICLISHERYRCPMTWNYFHMTKKCYKFLPIHVNRYQANEICDMLSARLGSIHSREENEFFGELLQNTQSAWIGLYVDGNQTLTRENETILSWEDGSMVDFVQWKNYSGSRNKRSISLDSCFTVHKARRRAVWHEEDCENFSHGVVCMK